MPADGCQLPLIVQGLGQHIHIAYYETSMGMSVDWSLIVSSLFYALPA